MRGCFGVAASIENMNNKRDTQMHQAEEGNQ
jgi:hypothetical protein